MSEIGKMDEMVEQVAKAILTAASSTAAYDDIAFGNTATILARAAIAAMREPTEAMMAEGGYQIPCERTDPARAKDVWTVMIDAALPEGQPK